MDVTAIKQRPPDLVIGRYTSLSETDKGWTGRCPFHEDQNPSFVVFRDGGWRCYGCRRHGGDVIDFLREKEGLGFREAAQMAATVYGVAIEEKTTTPPTLEVLDAAVRAYERAAVKSAAFRAFVRERGLDPAPHRLGFASREANQELARRFPRELLVAAGVAATKGGRCFPLMRDRVVIPVLDKNGRPVGLVGRAVGQSGPKYLTSNSEVWRRADRAYGEHMVGQASQQRIWVCEGPVDAMSIHKALGEPALAVLGTELTAQQAERLLALRPSAIELMFDGDHAGRKACIPALGRVLAALEDPVDIGVRVLPKGMDPDEMRKAGKDLGAVRRLDPVEAIVCAARKKFGLDHWHGRSQAAAWVANLLPPPPNPAPIKILRHMVAEELGVPVSALARREKAG